jgi:hypothetical protein
MGGYNAGEVASVAVCFHPFRVGRWLEQAGADHKRQGVRRAMHICVENSNSYLTQHSIGGTEPGCTGGGNCMFLMIAWCWDILGSTTVYVDHRSTDLKDHSGCCKTARKLPV